MKLLLTLLSIGMIGCSGQKPVQHTFKTGDCVEHKIDHKRGMVMNLFVYYPIAAVKFPASGKYPYMEEQVYEWEIEPCK